MTLARKIHPESQPQRQSKKSPHKRSPVVKLSPFSKKQRQILNWWTDGSPVKDADGIIADGSIRAGKTFPMAISFIEWAFDKFDGQAFAFAGKSIGAVGRNILFWLKPLLFVRGYHVIHRKNSAEGNYLDIFKDGKTNRFYIFGGADESSQDIVQGATLAGVLLDEVALMPESFVNQITGRCSVEGSKFWFNCNPDSPSHWFKREWLDKAAEKNLLHLHFTMVDNPSLSEGMRARYERQYTGVFFKRMILGLWVMAQGAIYDMFDEGNQYEKISRFTYERGTHYISIDYGTQNATIFLHIIDDGTKVWVENEYYYSGRDSGAQKTDAQFANDLDAFVKEIGKPIYRTILDPSAASFKAELRQRGYMLRDADNEVLDGIRMTGTMFSRKLLVINKRCKNLIREIHSYVWDQKPTDKGNEKPLKKDDHGPDNIRYFVKTVIKAARLARAA